MKITLIREDRESGKETLSTCEADAWIDRIKTETKEEHVTRLRSMLLYTNPDSGGYYEHIDKLPRIYPSVEFGRSRDNGRKLKHYNGVVMLEVNHLSGLSEVELVKRQAALLPQTWAAFAGSSGRSVKIRVKFSLPDGNLSMKEENVESFHAHAYRMAVQCYQPILPFPITLREPSITPNCRMTLDAYPYFNRQAIPFCLEQPFGMPGEETFRQRQLTEKNPLSRLKPGYETSQTFTLLFETTLSKALNEMEEWKRDAELYLGHFILINIDEFDQVSINQQGFLKHLLQKPVANLRKPYGSNIQEMRRYASFTGRWRRRRILVSHANTGTSTE